MRCVNCDQPIVTCLCPDMDARLRALAYDPTVYVAFKWCRACDTHYARCHCAVPDYYSLSGGRAIPVEGLRTITGEPPDVDLSPESERRHERRH